jgi:hypothetical protein
MTSGNIVVLLDVNPQFLILYGIDGVVSSEQTAEFAAG